MIVTRIGTPALVSFWDGQVHSVFRSSCNIRLPDGPLVCLHQFASGVLPYSFYVPDLDTQLFYPGQPVQARSDEIIVDEQYFIPIADDVEMVDTRITTGLLPRRCDTEWELLRQVRESQLRDDTLVRQVYDALGDSLDKLHHALLTGHQEDLFRYCQACIGFGQGLTPSGDDMLLGTFAALHGYAPELVPSLAQAASPLLARTNEISSSYLTLAMEGYATTPVLEVLRNLGSGKTQPVETLLSVGHASGSDILYGILATVKKLWDKEKGRK